MVEKKDFWTLVRKVLSYISVEPFVLCWVLPSCILIVAMENLNLEKACRVNLGMSREVCENMINKATHNINCVDVDLSANDTITDPEKQLEFDVCTAETESQKLLAVVFGLRSPIAAIFPFIIVLFAGGWSDKKGIRKPLVLFPILGELICAIILLLSAMFMDEIPMEVPAYSERIVPSLFGGQTLMLIGIYTYLTGKNLPAS
jgi:MFS transporter, PCFT/HCP family, solute carrier family 46, member 3